MHHRILELDVAGAVHGAGLGVVFDLVGADLAVALACLDVAFDRQALDREVEPQGRAVTEGRRFDRPIRTTTE